MPRASRTVLTVAAAGVLFLVASVFGGPEAFAAPPSRLPTAIVAVGDSTAAGEGGGGYEEGTTGEGGDWCHRSPNSYIQRAGLASTTVNLACAGASSADVGFTETRHYTEGSQAQRLVEVARRYRVTTVVAQLGANDDPGFTSSAVHCVAVYLAPSMPDCSATLAGQWPGRVAAMEPKVARALTDVRTAMRQAGYADQDYVLVLASYASPVTELMPRSHGFIGCPFRRQDAQWARTQAVPQLAAGLHLVADQVGARFLDLSRATEGHEACTTAGPEWQRRLTIDPKVFVHGGGFAAAGHLAQESFHPTAVGYRQLAGCLAEFVRTGAGSAQCVAGRDGNLHAVTSVPAPL